MLAVNADLFTEYDISGTVEPWKPEPLDHAQWPPDYRAVYAWRVATLAKLRADPELLASARRYYRANKAEFICHWCDTYNPRKAGGLRWVPFVLFRRQAEFVQFVEELRRDQENGLVEKCRDVGATWLASAYSVACFIFESGDAIGWGSRKQELVDKLGDPDSIFEKMRLLLRRLPPEFLPDGWKPREHATHMKLLNPANGSTVTGESGDNIGRGGRKSTYWKDESAHYERPEKIEAALGDNTNVQIDISSVNGLGNVFHRRRESGVDWQPGKRIDPGFTRVFVFDWRDHPEKTPDWYEARRLKAEREGMQHVFAQEVDRNYSAAVQNTIIAYEWIVAAVDAHLHVPCIADAIKLRGVPDVWTGGLDVADEGADRNALTLRQWIILRHCEEWGERDSGVTTRRAIVGCRNRARGRVALQYDSIGVGSGVKAEYNRLRDANQLAANDPALFGWNAGAGVQRPYDRTIPDDDESPLNRDMYANFKAQAWWSVRTRFYKTWRAREHGDVYDPDDLISLDSAALGAELAPLMKELAQPTLGTSSGLRIIVDKAPAGTRSPNRADSCVMAFNPVDDGPGVIVGSLSG